MSKISLNSSWICHRTGHSEKSFPIDIPHDAMLLDVKSENSPGGVNTGWYDCFLPEMYCKIRQLSL